MIIEKKFGLVLRSSGNRIEMTAGIGMPHTPANTPGFQQMSGCIIRIGPEAVGEFEMLGSDPLEALCNGLAALDMYLRSLSKVGDLRWERGDQYRPSEDPLGDDATIALAKSVDATPEDIRRGIERYRRLLPKDQ